MCIFGKRFSIVLTSFLLLTVTSLRPKCSRKLEMQFYCQGTESVWLSMLVSNRGWMRGTWRWSESIPEALRGGHTLTFFYLCCADSAELPLQENDEEEWPCGRTNLVHLYLSSSSESRIAESAALPLPPSPTMWMGNDLSVFAWHPLCLQLNHSSSIHSKTLSARVDECFFNDCRRSSIKLGTAFFIPACTGDKNHVPKGRRNIERK